MNDSSQVVVGANGQVYVAPAPLDPGSEPDDVTTALDAAFVELGFISEDGATFTEGKDITDIGAWQSFWPIRKIVTARTVQVAFAIRQWARENIEFALGGTVEDNGGEFTYTPPSPSELDERSLVLQWQDDDKNYRLWIPRGIVSENVEFQLVRTAAADLAVTFAALDPGDDAPVYTMFTDDPAFATVS